MKTYLGNLIIFFLIPIFFFIIVEGLIYVSRNEIFTEQIIEKAYLNVGNEFLWINKLNNSPQVILAGSSTVRYGLSCGQLNKLSNDSLSFVNISYDARDPIETYFILKQLDLKRVKMFCYGLDPWIFAKAWYRHRNSFLSLDLNTLNTLKFSIEYDNRLFLKRDVEYFQLFFKTNKSHSNSLYDIPDDFGSVKLNRKPKNFNEPVDKWFQIEKYGWSHLQFDYFMKIVMLCKHHNIEFYAFIPPKREDFCQTYKFKCVKIHKQFINKLLCENIDFRIFGKFDDLKSDNSNLYFQDIYHLNPKGQKIYTQLFFKMLTSNNKEKFASNYPWFN